MNIHEAGVSPRSVRYFSTPSSFAERVFFYSTRIGHYFCNRNYQFSCNCETALLPSHRFHYMLFLIKQGALELTIEGERLTAERNALVLFDCKRAHEYRALTDDLEFYWLIFDGPMSGLFYREILDLRGGTHAFPAPDPGQAHLLLTRLLTYAELPERKSEHTVSELIYSLLCGLLAGSTGADSSADSLIAHALRFMDQHFDARLSVEEVASHIGLSASHFTKQFRAHTGYSPYEYITLRRIDRAKELLIGTDQTVKQVAFETGYSSEENFIRSFKKKVGASPSVFRRYPI